MSSRLVACEDCGREISRRAAACPHCGCPVPQIAGSPPTAERTESGALEGAGRAPAPARNPNPAGSSTTSIYVLSAWGALVAAVIGCGLWYATTRHKRDAAARGQEEEPSFKPSWKRDIAVSEEDRRRTCHRLAPDICKKIVACQPGLNPSSLPPALETAGARLTAVRDTTATDVCLRLVGGYCDGSAWGFGDSATIDACFSGYAATTCECSKTNSTYCFPSSLSIDNKSDNGCPLLPMPNAEMYVSKMPDMTTALAFSSAYREEQRDTNNPATQLFARWAGSSGLEWNSISKTSTTAARVFKDEEAEFGRVLCDRGIIVQLTKQYPNSYEALVMFDYGNIIHLTALGDTGALVEKTSAAFCGVVTGVYTYSNTGGGTTHAVDAVGMFDLPSNRKKLSPPAATNPPAPSHPDRDALAGYCFRGNDEHGVRKFCSFTEADCKSLRDSQGVSAECFPIDRMPCTPSGSDIWCDVGL